MFKEAQVNSTVKWDWLLTALLVQKSTFSHFSHTLQWLICKSNMYCPLEEWGGEVFYEQLSTVIPKISTRVVQRSIHSTQIDLMASICPREWLLPFLPFNSQISVSSFGRSWDPLWVWWWVPACLLPGAVNGYPWCHGTYFTTLPIV